MIVSPGLNLGKSVVRIFYRTALGIFVHCRGSSGQLACLSRMKII